jgi:hypothetical protein
MIDLVVFKILFFLPVEDLYQARLVCKQWRTLVYTFKEILLEYKWILYAKKLLEPKILFNLEHDNFMLRVFEETNDFFISINIEKKDYYGNEYHTFLMIIDKQTKEKQKFIIETSVYDLHIYNEYLYYHNSMDLIKMDLKKNIIWKKDYNYDIRGIKLFKEKIYCFKDDQDLFIYDLDGKLIKHMDNLYSLGIDASGIREIDCEDDKMIILARWGIVIMDLNNYEIIDEMEINGRYFDESYKIGKLNYVIYYTETDDDDKGRLKTRYAFYDNGKKSIIKVDDEDHPLFRLKYVNEKFFLVETSEYIKVDRKQEEGRLSPIVTPSDIKLLKLDIIDRKGLKFKGKIDLSGHYLIKIQNNKIYTHGSDNNIYVF